MKPNGFRIFAGLSLLSLTCCSPLPLLVQDAIGRPKQFESRQIIVALTDAKRPQWDEIQQDITNRFDVQSVGEFPLKSIGVNCLVYQVSEMVDLDEVIRRLKADERIALVEGNRIFTALGISSGKRDYRDFVYAPKMIHADIVHQRLTGKGIKIAVVDTGADNEHPDLKDSVVSVQNFVDNGAIAIAEDKHGTAVAGVIGASADNEIGIEGIAPDAEIDVYKACWYADRHKDKAVCSSWTLAKAIDAAVSAGSRIINLSLNGPEDPLLEKLLAKANEHHIVVVAAAMEKGADAGFPASLDFVIPVISADPTGAIVRPQWKTQLPAMGAPGVEVLTTVPHARYDFISGSSLAAAHVSGVAALLLQHRHDLAPKMIKSVLMGIGERGSAAPDEEPSDYFLLDACRVLSFLSAPFACP
ncbi:MAG: S8 family peptidase [Gammaproteobacteria bacterium]